MFYIRSDRQSQKGWNVNETENYGQDGTTGRTPRRTNRTREFFAKRWPLLVVGTLIAGALIALFTTSNPVTRELESRLRDLGKTVEKVNAAKRDVWVDFDNKHFCTPKIQLDGEAVDATTISEDGKVVRIEKPGKTVIYRLRPDGKVERETLLSHPTGIAQGTDTVPSMPPVLEDCRR